MSPPGLGQGRSVGPATGTYALGLQGTHDVVHSPFRQQLRESSQSHAAGLVVAVAFELVSRKHIAEGLVHLQFIRG